MRILLALPLLFASSVSAGAEPANIDDYAKRSRDERPAALAAVKAELARVRKNRRMGDADKVATVTGLEKLIGQLEDPLEPYFAVAAFNVKTAKKGDIGRLAGARVDVYQVQDANNALIVGEWHQPYVPAVQSVEAAYRRIQEAAASPAREKVPESVVWYSGPTAGFVDGKAAQIDGVFAVTGEKTYQTAFGSPNTVPLIEKIELQKFADKFTRKDELRTWTAAGGHETQAILVRVDQGNVTLMNLDGKTVDVDLEKLGNGDRAYVRKWLSEQSKLAKQHQRSKSPRER